MTGFTPSRLLAAVLAAGAFAASAGANAGTSVHISVGVPVAPAPVVVHPQPVRVHAPAPVVVQHVHEPRYSRGHGRHDACRAPRWDPHVRYMPGDVVRRHGGLWVAKGVSARVWNENSPPEWTPRYWAAAECGV
jgi:hypothetical protein